MRANAWEGIGKKLKIKCKYYVSSRDVRIVCPRLESIYKFHSRSRRHPVFISHVNIFRDRSSYILLKYPSRTVKVKGR